MAAAQQGSFRVLASAILLQELAAIGVQNWSSLQRVLGYLRQIADGRLLRDTNDAAMRELRRGHALRRPESRLHRLTSESAWRLLTDRSGVRGVAEEAEREADEYLADERRLRDTVVAELRRHTPAGEKVQPNVWLWWTSDPAGRIWGFAEETAKSHGVDASPGLFKQLPAFWRFHAYKVARIALMHSRREGGALKKTDAADAHHYTAAAYVDIFVSDDTALHRTAEIVPRVPRPITLDDFARLYLGSPPPWPPVRLESRAAG